MTDQELSQETSQDVQAETPDLPESSDGQAASDKAFESPDCRSPYVIKLDAFEGPLDLLLHLIQESQMDIFDIEIAKITDQYLSYLDAIQDLDLEVAGEFLLMASTLAHLKSKMLLPPDPKQDDPEEEGQDPREALVRRLLEYQKYKHAAELLGGHALLGRDTFGRKIARQASIPKERRELAPVPVTRLVQAFHKILENIPLIDAHDISRETHTLRDCAMFIVDTLKKSPNGSFKFQEVFGGTRDRREMVTTFLAILDLLRKGVILVYQSEVFDDIQLMGTAKAFEDFVYQDSHEWTERSTRDAEEPNTNSQEGDAR